jgi:hypothetical protein
VKASSSFDERPTTGILLEGPPCSKTGERWWREKTSGGDPGSGGDSDGAGGGVATLLGDEEPPFEGSRGHLIPLLSSNVVK